MLQQEVAFFDTDTSSGKLLNGLNADTLAIQEAISEKVGNFVHHLCTFLVGIAIGQSDPEQAAFPRMCSRLQIAPLVDSAWFYSLNGGGLTDKAYEAQLLISTVDGRLPFRGAGRCTVLATVCKLDSSRCNLPLHVGANTLSACID